MKPSAARVASRWLSRTAGLTFRHERSPRLEYGHRLVINDSEAEEPPRSDRLFRDQYRTWSERGRRRLKKPVLTERGVTDPGDIAYIDYTGGGRDFYIHLVIVRGGRQGEGLATKLLREFYKRVPEGAAVRWGRILNPTAWHLFEKMKKERPDVVHMGSKFH